MAAHRSRLECEWLSAARQGGVGQRKVHSAIDSSQIAQAQTQR
jgi:hypothetical protein